MHAGNRLCVSFRNELTDEVEEHEAGQLVVEHGTRPADALFHALAGRSSNGGAVDERALLAGAPRPEGEGEWEGGGFRLFRIGDAVSSRNIYAAVLDAFRLCRTL